MELRHSPCKRDATLENVATAVEGHTTLCDAVTCADAVICHGDTVVRPFVA
jgi:hypothetical protein